MTDTNPSSEARLREQLAGLRDIELISAKIHEGWMATKRMQGIVSRRSEAGEELMVPYEQLSESAKDLDRGSVRAVLEAQAALAAHPAGVELGRPNCSRCGEGLVPYIVNNKREVDIWWCWKCVFHRKAYGTGEITAPQPVQPDGERVSELRARFDEAKSWSKHYGESEWCLLRLAELGSAIIAEEDAALAATPTPVTPPEGKLIATNIVDHAAQESYWEFPATPAGKPEGSEK